MRMVKCGRSAAVFAATLAALLWSCAGSDGKIGLTGQSGVNGQPGTPGADGQPGSAGPDGQNGTGLSTGINFTIRSVAVAADGTLSAAFDMVDDQGAPVDTLGVYSKGAAKPRFGLGRLDAVGEQYVTLTRSSSAGPTMLNTANANTGTVAESPARSGHYTYVFPQKYPAMTGVDASKTHTIFVQVTRQLDMLEPSSRFVANVSHDFVPAGGTPISREVVTTAACNQCHNPLAIHGGGRRDVKLCGVCHQAELGNFNLPFFVHAIHSRQNLNADGDFSEVTYPKPLGDCSACHGGAAQGAQAITKPSAIACTGCHKYLKFDGTAAASCNPAGAWGTTTDCNHIASQGADSKCALCHDAEKMQADHGAPAVYWSLANTPPNKVDAAAKNPVVKTVINAVSFDANRIPTFTFTVTTSYDGGPDLPRNLLALPLQTIRVSWATSLAGATAMEYVTVLASQRWNIPGWAPVAPGAVLPVSTGTAGQYKWTAPTAVPAADAQAKAFPPSQTFAFAIETAEGDEFAPYVVELRGITSPVFFWRLDNQNTGSNRPLARRRIVDDAKCFACHGAPHLEQGFGFHHAGSRNNVQACAFCHDAVTTDQRTTRILPVSGTETRLDQSIQLSVMVHKMHLGAGSQAAFNWKYYNNGGAPLERVTYPGDLMDCAQCHVTPTAPNTSVWGLPLNAAVNPTTKSIWYDCNTSACTATETVITPRTTAVCGSCHDSPQAEAHMTQHVATVSGTATETCDVCHGLYKEFDVRKLHVPAP